MRFLEADECENWLMEATKLSAGESIYFRLPGTVTKEQVRTALSKQFPNGEVELTYSHGHSVQLTRRPTGAPQ